MAKVIMIVDDSATMLMSIEAILASAGHQVLKHPSAEDALAALKGGAKPNLVITDLHMGAMSGIDLIGNIRKLADFQFMPIVLLTTEVQQDKRTQAKAAGATGWISKPVDPAALLQVVRQLLPGA